jgi:hypothetical protein
MERWSTASRTSHTGKDFLSFMKLLARRYRDGELYVILDNSSTHTTPDVKAWLAENPRVVFHFTPISASWLNLVEALFSLLKLGDLFDARASEVGRSCATTYALSSRRGIGTRSLSSGRRARAIIRDHRKLIALIPGTKH